MAQAGLEAAVGAAVSMSSAMIPAAGGRPQAVARCWWPGWRWVMRKVAKRVATARPRRCCARSGRTGCSGSGAGVPGRPGRRRSPARPVRSGSARVAVPARGIGRVRSRMRASGLASGGCARRPGKGSIGRPRLPLPGKPMLSRSPRSPEGETGGCALAAPSPCSSSSSDHRGTAGGS